MIDRNQSSKRYAAATLVVVFGFVVQPARGITQLYAENFEDVTKFTSPTYGLPNAWSPNPPPGWDTTNVIPPGGIPEWRGWTFWDKRLWQGIGEGPRVGFDRGRGTIAIADNDLWNDDNDPARLGFYNTFLQSAPISLDRRRKDEQNLVLSFDTSWFARECCDDADTDPNNQFRNNQTGIVRARMSDGSHVDLLRWESAPFRDGQGRPTDDPIDPAGNPNNPNCIDPNTGAILCEVIPLELNERVHLDLAPFFPPPGMALLTSGDGPALSTGGGEEIVIEFAMEDAGDDGYWAVDNVQLASFVGEIDGDLYIDGVLDAKDIDEFALGLLDEAEYTAKWSGETPGARGSDDESFDYDDIEWFLNIMETSSSVEAPALALARALQAIPEPSSAMIVTLGVAVSFAQCRRGACR